MRFIVFGVGAVGGTIAGKLARAGIPVAGIARGPQLAALQRDGLTLATPEGVEHSRFPVHANARDIAFNDDDVILLCMKSQHTAAALADLRDAGVRNQPVVCVQNGVANEALALRLFESVYSICVMLPCSYLQPGVVHAYSVPKPGILDVGRYPHGADATADVIADTLELAGFASQADTDIMSAKYGKLLLNLGNAIGAALGARAHHGPYHVAAREEGERVLRAREIRWTSVDFDNERRAAMMRIRPVDGQRHPGSSSWQSLERDTGSVETDYLNGEIVLQGRLCGVPTPVNAYFNNLMHEMLATGARAGSIPPERVERECPLDRAAPG